ANNYTTVARFSDPNSGAHWYTADFTINTAGTPLPAGPANTIAHYSFDNTFDDSTANMLHANPGAWGSPEFNVDDKQFGTASADFEADNLEHLFVRHDSALANLDNMTIAMWLKPESWDGSRRIFQKGGDDELSLMHNIGRGWLYSANEGNDLEAAETEAFLPLGEWHHIALVVDGDNDLMELYKDGIKSASVGLGGSGVSSTLAPLWIGHKDGGTSNGDNFDGLMDELFIYDDALNAAQINNLMNFNTPVPEPSTFALLAIGAVGLIVYWRRRKAA
ncbi:MAG: LamG-like jellyroll fold domain-containing protein, partial [Thermoguttaceae bacterium]